MHPLDSKYAKEKGFNIKLVANAKRIGGSEIAAWVLPTLVPANSQLYAIRNEFNGVLIGSKLADEQFLYGKGAGRYPTSSAVLSDIAALRYNYKYEYKKSNSEIKYQLSNNYLLKVFVSFNSSNEVNENDFVQIEETFRSVNRQYLIGNIGLTELREAKWFNSDNVSVIVMP